MIVQKKTIERGLGRCSVGKVLAQHEPELGSPLPHKRQAYQSTCL